MACSEFAKSGRLWLRNAISSDDLTALCALCPADAGAGERLALAAPLSRALSQSPFNTQLRSLWPGMRPVRVLSFNKSQQANWLVPWHQDRVIAVADKHDCCGYSNWSQKAGAWHCAPPTEVLVRMLFVRVHLDPSTIENGAMEIALGSHSHGLVAANDAARVAQSCTTELTVANPGDVLVLSMMMLHRSRPASAD